MKSLVVLTVALVLAGCDSGPHLGVGIGIGSGGVSVHPTASGSVGGVGVTVSG